MMTLLGPYVKRVERMLSTANQRSDTDLDIEAERLIKDRLLQRLQLFMEGHEEEEPEEYSPEEQEIVNRFNRRYSGEISTAKEQLLRQLQRGMKLEEEERDEES